MEKTKLWRIAENLLAIFIIALLLIPTYGFIRDYPGYDDTDDVVNGIRSNMELFIDHGTGCHYLASRGFLGYTTLIPRLDMFGEHVCKGAN